MLLTDDGLSNALVTETLQFTRSALDASAAVFFWIEEGRRVGGIETAGISADIMQRYLGGMNVYDPLNVYELLDNKRRVAMLEQERHRHSADDNRIYAEFLGSYGVVDEVDFLFWQDGLPFACLAVLKGHGDRPFGDRMLDWEAMRRYMEFNLQMHARMRQAKLTTALATRYGLTRREIEVVGLLAQGAANSTIAEIMGIGVATVKTYVINILDKLKVQNRSAIVAFTARLQMP